MMSLVHVNVCGLSIVAVIIDSFESYNINLILGRLNQENLLPLQPNNEI